MDTVEKISDTQIKVTSTTQIIIPVDEFVARRAAALAIIGRLDTEYAARKAEQQAIIDDCESKIALAKSLGVVSIL